LSLSELKNVPSWTLAQDLRLVLLVVLVAGIAAVWVVDQLADRLFVRRVPVGERERGWLALAAPYFRVHSFRSGDLGGKTPLGRFWMKRFIKRDWGIVDRATAIEALNDLLHHGHRENPHLRDANQPATDLETVDRALLAWDAMRVIFLARCCFALGHLDEQETWSFVYAGVGLAATRGAASRTFRNWGEWGRSWVIGRMLWSAGTKGTSYYEYVVEKLLAKPSSVWNRYEWESVTRR
jgi:hypothetical protein